MDELSQVLAEATQAIEPGYFRLAIDGGDPVYRERVYCYELYHQILPPAPEPKTGSAQWRSAGGGKAANCPAPEAQSFTVPTATDR
jgi:hypothetical protein